MLEREIKLESIGLLAEEIYGNDIDHLIFGLEKDYDRRREKYEGKLTEDGLTILVNDSIERLKLILVSSRIRFASLREEPKEKMEYPLSTFGDVPMFQVVKKNRKVSRENYLERVSRVRFSFDEILNLESVEKESKLGLLAELG